MSDERKEYDNDTRVICKYGNKCYQINPQHHAIYKHPPRNMKLNRGKRTHRFNPYSKEDKDYTEQNSTKVDGTSILKPAEKLNTNKEQIVENPEKGSNTTESLETAHEEQSNVTKNVEQEVEKCFKIPQDNLIYYDPTKSCSVFKELFLVDMPPDFFKLYECLNNENSFEKTLSSVNLEAIGPFDLLLGKLPKLDDRELYLSHWRFFYDPPEFQAIFKKNGKSEYHIGYFRDDPSEKPVFLASNNSAKDCLLTPMAENIFGAVYLYLQNEKKSSPFTAMMCQKMMDKLKKYADENKYSLDGFNVKKRLSHAVTKTFHGAGIMVPYNKKSQLGYRRLVESDANIKNLFAKLQAAKTEGDKDIILSEIQPIITYASIAVDECDFGTGIEVGIDLFCSGLKELESPALSSLTATYPLLNREAFSKIIQAHLKFRRRGPNMSILSLAEK